MALPGPRTSALQARCAWRGEKSERGHPAPTRAQPAGGCVRCLWCEHCRLAGLWVPDRAQPFSGPVTRRFGFHRGRTPRLCSLRSLHLTLTMGQWTHRCVSGSSSPPRDHTWDSHRSPQRSRAEAPGFGHLAPLSAAGPEVRGPAAGPRCCPPLPLATPPGAHQGSAPLRCRPGWQELLPHAPGAH